MESKIKFIIPNLYENYEQNIKFLTYFKEHPECFYDNIEIEAVYGNFQFCIWDGGRIFNSYRQSTKEEIISITDRYNELGITTRLVFTNTELKEKDYYNRFCNKILNICADKNTDIVINNEGLKNYIHNIYPSYNFISSTTKCLNEQDLKEELNKDYKMVCLDYNLNKNKTMLESLDENQRNKCEFLVNAICNPACPFRKNHYRLNSIFYLNYGKEYKMDGCNIVYGILHPTMINSKNNLTIEEIKNYYIPNHFNHFKLEGRSLSWTENLCNYIRYMVKPEYQLYVISELLR